MTKGQQRANSSPALVDHSDTAGLTASERPAYSHQRLRDTPRFSAFPHQSFKVWLLGSDSNPCWGLSNRLPSLLQEPSIAENPGIFPNISGKLIFRNLDQKLVLSVCHVFFEGRTKSCGPTAPPDILQGGGAQEQKYIGLMNPWEPDRPYFTHALEFEALPLLVNGS